MFRFTQIAPADAGDYSCSAENDAGRATAVGTLVVHTYPELTVIPNKEYIEVEEGAYVKLECRGDGIPRPTVQWIKPNQQPLITS